MKKKQILSAVYAMLILCFALGCDNSGNAGESSTQQVKTQLDIYSAYQNFRDYPSDISQLDTTTRVSDEVSVAYLDRLISLEKANVSGSVGFGTHLPDIATLLKKYPLDLQQAMYHYLYGLYQVKMQNNPKLGSNALLEATKYFESNKDTTGMLHAYFYLVTININPMDKVVGSEHNAKNYYAKIITLGERSTAPQDKLLMYHAILIFNNRINNDKEITKSMNAFLAAQQLIKENPKYDYLTHPLNANVSRLLLNFGRFDDAQKYLETEYEYLKQNGSNVVLFAVTTMNLAYVYEQKGYSFAGEKLLTEAIGILKKADMPESNLLVESYKQLAEIKFKLKKYDSAWRTRASADSLATLQDATNQQRAVLEVQEKYENEKKVAEIQQLTAETKYLNQQKVGYIVLILFFLLLAATIAVFARRLQKANVRLEKAQQTKRKLFSIIAHDLAAPITTYNDLASTFGYLVRTKQTEKIEQLSRQIDRTGAYLSLLLSNLFNWSLQKQNEIKPNLQQIAITDWVKNYIHIAEHTAVHKNVSLVELPITTSISISTDPDMLGIVLRNMLDNAVKNAPPNTQVTVSIETNKQGVLVNVTNLTTDLSQDKINTLQKHFDGSKPLFFGQEGTRLGIQLIKEYADVLGGILTIAKTENTVSCTLLLPK